MARARTSTSFVNSDSTCPNCLHAHFRERPWHVARSRPVPRARLRASAERDEESDGESHEESEGSERVVRDALAKLQSGETILK
jgi:hypothetical protein